MILTEQAAFNYLASRREALYVEINSLRANLLVEIEKTKKRLDNLPPFRLHGSTEAHRDVSGYSEKAGGVLMVCKCGHGKDWHRKLNEKWPSVCFHVKTNGYCACMKYRERGSDA